jgi:hypothetical protein
LFNNSFPIHLIKNFLEKQKKDINIMEDNETLKQNQEWFTFSFFGK